MACELCENANYFGSTSIENRRIENKTLKNRIKNDSHPWAPVRTLESLRTRGSVSNWTGVLVGGSLSDPGRRGTLL